MQDGDIDYRQHTMAELVEVLRHLDAQRFPHNFANARRALKEKWPDAPDDPRSIRPDQLPQPLALPHTPADGARRFTVRFSPPTAPAPGEPCPNNIRLAGEGSIVVTATGGVVLADTRGGPARAEHSFALDQLANIEWCEAAAFVILRTRSDERTVVLWMQSRADLLELIRLLPRVTTPQFLEQRAKEQSFERHMQELAPKAPVTPALIAVNVVVFGLMVMAGAGMMDLNPAVHQRFGSNIGALTWNGEPWRLLTCAFIHFGVVHLAFNMYALHNGGVLTEKLYGSARFLVIYLLSALSGSVVSSWWDAARNSAGASGAVFGVYGALLAFFAVRREDIPIGLLKSAGKGALLLCGYSLAMGAASPFIDNAAHVGGLLGGIAAGALLARPFEPQARREAQPGRVATVAVLVCAVLAMLSVRLWKQGS